MFITNLSISNYQFHFRFDKISGDLSLNIHYYSLLSQIIAC